MVDVRIWPFLYLGLFTSLILKADKKAIRAALDGTPVENHCPIQDETFVGCCGLRELSSKAEDSTTKSISLMPGLCSITK